MAMKHTEFIKLTQGNKSLTEYLQAFNNLTRYAIEFVDTDAKKIASFKRGLGPKLMKTMGTSKCATFNEFISDALTQENNNSIYAISKSRNRAFEAGASQSRALIAPRTPSRPPTTGAKFCPPQKKAPAKTGFRKAYTVSLPKGSSSQGSSSVPPSNMPCWNCNKPGHWSRNCPYPKKNANPGVRQGQAHYNSIEKIPSGEVVTASKFLVDQHPAVVLFDSGASHSFISPMFASKFAHKLHTIEDEGYCIRAASGNIPTNQVVSDVEFEIEGQKYLLTLVVLPGLGIDVILGMNWMSQNGVLIDTSTRVVMIRDPTDQKGFLVQLPRKIDLSSEVHAVQAKSIDDIPVVCEFPNVFPDDLSGLPPDQDVEFKIELLPCTAPISRRPYRMAPNELADLKV
jgi:hypothetical protein